MDNQTPDGAEPYDQFEDEDDFQLMEWIAACRDEDPETARAAWGCLYLRHASYLLNVTRVTARGILGNDAAAEDVVANIFLDLYEKKVDSFKPSDECLDDDAKRRYLRAWLGKIVERDLLDMIRSQKRLPSYQIDQDHWSDISGEEKSIYGETETTRVRELMGQVLDDREQDIIRTTYQYYDPSTGTPPKLSTEELQRLCTTYDITPENLRQIRVRAIRRLTEALATVRQAG